MIHQCLFHHATICLPIKVFPRLSTNTEMNFGSSWMSPTPFEMTPKLCLFFFCVHFHRVC